MMLEFINSPLIGVIKLLYYCVCLEAGCPEYTLCQCLKCSLKVLLFRQYNSVCIDPRFCFLIHVHKMPNITIQ